MLANVMRLEFRKQRQDFLVVVGIAAAVVLCLLVEAVYRNRNLGEVLKDVFAILSVGFVIVLALTGATSARNLRSEPYKSAEEALPFSSAQRTLGAYLVNVLYLLAGSSLFLLGAYTFGSSKNLSWMQPALSILLIIHFHMLCFIFAYWLNHNVLAIVIAALIVWFERVFVLQRSFFLLFLHNPYVSEAEPIHTLWSAASFIVSFVGGLVALALISTRIERQQRLRWIPGLVASVILISGGILLFLDLIGTSYKAQTRLVVGNYYYWANEYLTPSSGQTENSGLYLRTYTGNILHITPERRNVLRKVPLTLFSLLSKPKELDVVSAHEDSNTGEFWAIIRNDETDRKDFGIWRSIKGEKLILHSEFASKGVWPSYFIDCGTKKCIYGYTPTKIARATLTESGLSEWQFFPGDPALGSLGQIRNILFKEKLESGKVASLSPDKKILSRHLSDGTVQKWSLPGKGELYSFMATTLPPAFYKNNQPHFVLPVSDEKNVALYVCNVDGSITRLGTKSWTNNQRFTWDNVPGGGSAWVLRDLVSWKANEILVLSETGIVYPPFRIQTTPEYANFVNIVKKENEVLWILTGENLSKIHLGTGQTLQKFDLNLESEEYFENIFRSRTKEGVYFVKDNRICLIDWNGKIRDLGPASL